MAKKQLVLAIFENEAAADAAVESLKKWDKASKEVKLGAIGILVKDDKGKIKKEKVGSRKTSTGAVIGVVAALLTGGMSLLGGAVVGGIVGAFFHKGLGLKKDDLAKLDGELNDGKAAVGVLAKAKEADGVSAKLTELGGVAESYKVSDEAIDQAQTAAEAAEEDADTASDDSAEAENSAGAD